MSQMTATVPLTQRAVVMVVVIVAPGWPFGGLAPWRATYVYPGRGQSAGTVARAAASAAAAAVCATVVNKTAPGRASITGSTTRTLLRAVHDGDLEVNSIARGLRFDVHEQLGFSVLSA